MSPKKQTTSEPVEQTIITSVERMREVDTDRRAYILFLSGPLQGKLYCLEQTKTVIGRADDTDIPIHDARISRHHLQILSEGGRALIEDMGSTNGTYVNGKSITRRILEDGDKIQIPGGVVIKFAYGDRGERMFLDEFYHMANFDAVTGAHTKHVFATRIKEEFAHAKRNKQPLSLLMIDLDYFKKVNDTYGHLAGDFVLSHVAHTITDTARTEDIVCRYGGEEFALILRGIDAAGATGLAERIRKTVETNPAPFEEKQIPVTVSIGVATLQDDNFATPKDLIAAADAQLYQAKEGGRNRVMG